MVPKKLLLYPSSSFIRHFCQPVMIRPVHLHRCALHSTPQQHEIRAEPKGVPGVVSEGGQRSRRLRGGSQACARIAEAQARGATTSVVSLRLEHENQVAAGQPARVQCVLTNNDLEQQAAAVTLTAYSAPYSNSSPATLLATQRDFCLQPAACERALRRPWMRSSETRPQRSCSQRSPGSSLLGFAMTICYRENRH